MAPDPNTTLGRALRAIVHAPQAWCPVEMLRRQGVAGDALGELQAAGWACIWDRDRQGRPLTYESLCLTPWAARILGLELVEVGPKRTPAWTHAGEASGKPLPRPDRMPRHRRLRFPELVPDRKRKKYLADLETFEETDDPFLAPTLLGTPVVVDPRLGRNRRTKRRA